jgi:ATP-dependent Lon protease
LLAAHRAGISTFVLPRKNEKDLEEIPQKVRKQLELVPVDSLDEVLRVALRPTSGVGEPKSEPAQGGPSRAKAPVQRRRGTVGVGTGVHPS